MTIGMGPGGTGVLRMVRPGVYLHWCCACLCGHTFDVHEVNQDGRVVGYDGDPIRPSLGQPLRHEKDGAVCEYIIKGGVQHFFSSCTHGMAGQSVPMPDYPR